MFTAALFIIAKNWKQAQNEVHAMKTLFSNKNEWSTVTCYNINERQKHCAKWNKPDAKDYIVCDSIPMKCPEKVNL